MNRSKITMEDIAREANVSKSTVSRALNNDRRIRIETREKIKEIARELNYRPHKVAQALARQSTNIIGVELPFTTRSVADPFFLEFLQGIGEIAVVKNYSLTLSHIDQDNLSGLLAVFNRSRVDGVILTEPFFEDPRIACLEEEGLPYVFLGNPMAGEGICWVESDNLEGSYQAVRHLIDSGHRRIAIVTGPQDLVAGRYRLEGYKKALRESGLPVDPGLIYNGDFTQQGAFQAAQRLLEERRDFTAIFASNDLMAVAVIRALKEMGISIPGDIAVMGYDGVQLGAFIDPPLSTVKIPGKKMGRMAVKLLLQKINGERIRKKQIVLPSELILRGSA